jgi:hypothetical protein
MNKDCKILSEYSDNGKKAVVMKDLKNGDYVVSAMYDTGTSFAAHFVTEEDAEDFAEGWVLGTLLKHSPEP